MPTSIQNLVNKQPVMTPLPAEVAKPLSKQVIKEEVETIYFLMEKTTSIYPFLQNLVWESMTLTSYV